MSQSEKLVAPETPSGGGKATASLVLGILGLIAWCVVIVGLPLTLTGLVLGVLDLHSAKRRTAIAGVVINGIGLLLSVVNGVTGALLAIQAQGGG